MSRMVQGVPVLQVGDFESGAAVGFQPPGATAMLLRCVHCNCSVVKIAFHTDVKVLGVMCANCGQPAMNAIAIEAGDGPSGIVLANGGVS